MRKDHDLLYAKIEKYITGQIKTGKLKEGDRLPSEQDLSKRFNASRIPVRQATQKLVDRGIIQRMHGKGTFVKRSMDKLSDTDRIAVLFCHSDQGFFNSMFYSAIFSGIQMESHVAKRTLVIRAIPALDQENPSRIFYDLMNDVDGFILVDAFPETYQRMEKTIKNLAKPIVVLNYEAQDDDVDMVIFDSYENTKKMMAFLFGLGHRRIVFIYRLPFHSSVTNPNHTRRLKGYSDALTEHGLSVEPKMMRYYEEFVDHGGVFKEFLSGSQRPTALLCADDEVALMMYTAAEKNKLSVPQDITIVGYDNIRDSQMVQPPLTTVNTPLAEMGAMGVKRLLEKMKEHDHGITTHYRIVLPGSILERASHRRI